MSAFAQRRRQQQLERERALLTMRDSVRAVLVAEYRHAGSDAIDEALDQALEQLLTRRVHRRDLDHIHASWIVRARGRLIDYYLSADRCNRAAITVDDSHDTLGIEVDVAELSEERRRYWRIKELLSVLSGDERIWAEAYYDAVLADDLKPGAQPRGLPEKLGWSGEYTKTVSRRARRKMTAFIRRRAAGVICAQRRSLLDAFIAQTTGRDLQQPGLDSARCEDVLTHIAACEECWLAWRERRRALVASRALLAFPVHALIGAWHALGEKLAGLPGRVGIGGAATGAAAATVSAKTATTCVVLCVAGVGVTAELTGVLPLPDTPLTKHHQAAPAKRADAHPARSSALRAPPTTPAVTRATPPPPPTAARPATTRQSTSARTQSSSSSSTVRQRTATPPPPPPPPPSGGTEDFTPGDLPPASSAAVAPVPPPPVGSPECVPGDLAC